MPIPTRLLLTFLPRKTSEYMPLHLPLVLFVFFSLISCVPSAQVESIEWKPEVYAFTSKIDTEFKGSQDRGRAATQYSFNGEYEKALKVLDVDADTVRPAGQRWIAELDKFEKRLANAAILDRSKDHEILMFNEAHYTALHRHFVMNLLDDLYDIGYRTLALETLSMTDRYDGEQYDKGLEKRGYPKIHSGYYTKEPQFGRLVRKAADLGYQFIGYDQGSGSEREIMGAKGILKRWGQLENPGKLVILCGWDHIKEGPAGTYWEYALAGRLKEYSGHDPLTVNQTKYSPRSDRVFEDSIYQLTDVEEPTVFLREERSFAIGPDTAWYDLMVFHPRERFEKGIPTWLLEGKPTYTYTLPDLDLSYPYKLFFFEPEDDINEAVPIHIVEVSSGKEVHLPHFIKGSKVVVYDGKSSILISE
jgi:hypothetical protein